MSLKVLLDTGFLIALTNKNDPDHQVAKEYYELLTNKGVEIYLSTIVASEFAVKQAIEDLPLDEWLPLSFNLPHSVKAGKFKNAVFATREKSDRRDVVANDISILAQAAHEQIAIILSRDKNTMHKWCSKLNDAQLCSITCVLLKDGFHPASLGLSGDQKSLV
ncbi:MAG: type II toxin-antitoxin system VapC family toxin [Cytophagales bacterium]|nr:type II toxin-antitoxin system VapC family toxin [Cytophagales bacterium]